MEVVYEKLLNIKILEKRDGKAKLSMPFQKELTNPYGVLHGGAIASLVDSAAATAVYSRYPEKKFYTVRLHLDFKSAVKSGTIFAEAHLTGQKRNFVFGKVVVADDGGTLIAEAAATFYIIQE